MNKQRKQLKSMLPRLRRPMPFRVGPTRLNLRVFLTSGLFVVALACFAIMAPDVAGEYLGDTVAVISRWLGWLYIALATIIFCFVFWLALSRYGNMRLGADDSRPEYSLFTWAAMLFAAGIGTDILFFSVAEPVTHYLAPPTGMAQTPEAARQAVVWGLFHYGVTGWGMYALVGVALGYFAYRRNLPLSVRSALFPLFGKRIAGVAGDVVDTAAVIGTIFGVVASLGIGVVQIALGIAILTGMQPSIGVQIVLVVLAVSVASLSATTGLDRGIRLLSELNVLLGLLLGAWVLFTGDTPYLLSAFVTNVGDYISRFPGMTLDTMIYSNNSEWLASWTLFFWAWWIAWASFIGMFLARISRGRTIREFVLGSLAIPFIYVAMWINIFGDDAIYLIRNGNTTLAKAVQAAPENGIYFLLQAHPAATFTIALAVLLGLLFYVTSADSGALVMANLCSTLASPNDDGSKWVRVFWAAMTGVVTVAMLSVGGIPALQNATIIMAVPFSLVLILVMIGLAKALTDETRHRELHALTYDDPLAEIRSDGVPWSQRLAAAMSVVDPAQAREALAREVLPAMRDVADLLTQQGAMVTIDTNDDSSQVKLTVGADSVKFKYIVSIDCVPSPAFAGHMVRKGDLTTRISARVPGRCSSYDLMGLNRDQIRNDIVDAYEHHLNFLAIYRVDKRKTKIKRRRGINRSN